jgi:hypothetical protein
MTRVRITIDRIVADTPGLDRAALERAIRAEVTRTLASGGAGAFGSGGTRAEAGGALAPGTAPLPARVAAAAVRAVKP